jgi:hypothetical protein
VGLEARLAGPILGGYPKWLFWLAYRLWSIPGLFGKFRHRNIYSRYPIPALTNDKTGYFIAPYIS